MCIIIKQGVPVLLQWKNSLHCSGMTKKIGRQGGFTLVEVLVSLCILTLMMHGVLQWGTVMQRTSEAMVQNQQAVFLMQQVFSGIEPQCPEGWNVQIQSKPIDGTLYETQVMIQSQHRQWQFYYAGPEEL